MAHVYTHYKVGGVEGVEQGRAQGLTQHLEQGGGVLGLLWCSALFVCCLVMHLASRKPNFLLIFLPQFFLGVSGRKQKQVTGSPEVSQVPGVLRQVCREGKVEGGVRIYDTNYL